MSQHSSIVKKICPVYGSQCFTDVMIRQEDPDPLFLEGKDDFRHFAHTYGVYAAERLIKQKEFRRQNQRPGNLQPSALPPDGTPPSALPVGAAAARRSLVLAIDAHGRRRVRRLRWSTQAALQWWLGPVPF